MLNDRIRRIRRHAHRVYINVQFECAYSPERAGHISKLPTELRRMGRPQNMTFVGRDDILDLMKEKAGISGRGENAESQRGSMLLHGLGGIGKTEIAVQFCHLHWRSFKWILWFSADNEAKIKATVTSYLFELFGLPAGTSVDNPEQMFRSWLQDHSKLPRSDRVDINKLFVYSMSDSY